MNEEIVDKIHKKQKVIVTDFDLSGFGYYRTGKYRKIQRWTLKTYQDELNKDYQKRNPEKTSGRFKKYYLENREKEQKRKKKYYQNNCEKIKIYSKRWKKDHPKECRASCRRWELQHKEERKKLNKKWYQENPEKVKAYKQKFYRNHRDSCLEKQKTYAESHQTEIVEYRKEYYQSNKEEIIEKVHDYIHTPAGRLCVHKRNAKHKQKGFICLNQALSIEFDWHHLHKELPFVMAIPRSLHRQRMGKKHYDEVNTLAGLNIFIDETSNITAKDYIENVVELFFPEQFRQYWIGDYYGGGNSVLAVT